MGLKIEAAACCSIGRRKNNEDNFYANGQYMEREQMNRGGQYRALVTDELQMYAVCDGMGGAEFGEEASLKAVKALKRYQSDCPQPDSSKYLEQMIDGLSRDIDRISLDKGIESGSCGSTIAMLILRNDSFRTVHVGDSRVYRFRGGHLSRMTRDDSEVQDMVDRGEITLDQAWRHPRKNVITRHLGMPTGGTRLLPAISPRQPLKEGDRFMICSDGVSDQLHDTMIREILTRGLPAKDVAELIVRTALKDADNAGVNSDNITCIILDVKQTGAADYDDKRIRRLKILRGAAVALSAAALGLLGFNLYRLIDLLR